MKNIKKAAQPRLQATRITAGGYAARKVRKSGWFGLVEMIMITVAQYAVVAVIIGVATLIRKLLGKNNSQLPTKIQRIGRVLAQFAGVFFLVSGSGILFGLEMMENNFRQWNLLYLFKYIGVFEITFGLLILIPRTYKLGFLFALPLLGGGMATHFPMGLLVQFQGQLP